MEPPDDRRRLETLEKRLLLEVGRCNQDFGLIEDGDRILVGVSGGKDSLTLLHLLHLVRRRSPVRFEVLGVTLDQGHPGFPADRLVRWAADLGYPFEVVRRNTYQVVLDKVPEGKTFCSLCSRLRRGILYQAAVDRGCTKIALGHHREDLIETLLLNLFYSGQLKAMPPRLVSDDGRNVVIRPMAYVAEAAIAEYAEAMGFPVIPCDLCGSQSDLKRQQIKGLLGALDAENDHVKGNLLAALGNVVPGHLLDRRLLARLAAAEDDDAPRVAAGA